MESRKMEKYKKTRYLFEVRDARLMQGSSRPQAKQRHGMSRLTNQAADA
jgi:hypothetical protein